MLHEYNKILVTGGLGFVGSNPMKTLSAMGKEIIVFDNRSTGLNRIDLPSGKVVEGETRDPESLEEVMTGIDLVFHSAANANGTLSIEDMDYDFQTNNVGSFNIINAAVKAKVKRFAYVSSAAVYGIPQLNPVSENHPIRPIFPYGASKLCGELNCLSFFHSQGFPVVVGRPFAIHGPGENPKVSMVEIGRYIRRHLNHMPLQIVGDMDEKIRDFVPVFDVVSALILNAEKSEPGQIFHIGSGTQISMRDLGTAIEKATQREVKIKNHTHMLEDSYALVSDISKLGKLGYEPKVDLFEGLTELSRQLGDFSDVVSSPVSFTKGTKV